MKTVTIRYREVNVEKLKLKSRDKTCNSLGTFTACSRISPALTIQGVCPLLGISVQFCRAAFHCSKLKDRMLLTNVHSSSSRSYLIFLILQVYILLRKFIA
jgi:hypothetical protein